MFEDEQAIGGILFKCGREAFGRGERRGGGRAAAYRWRTFAGMGRFMR
jgi:hypothetical protein